MPVRDARATVETALESVKTQTFTDWELVIVDDGSEDGTTEVLKHFAEEEDRFVLIPQNPKGIAAALQSGCEACRGEFIARMDADDTMDARRLEVQRAFLIENADCGLVSSRVRFWGTEAGYASHVEWINSLMNHDAMSLRRFVEAPVAHPSVMFRRELLEGHGGYREGDFPEDYELWLRWLEAGVRFGKVDAELLTWNDPPQRLSRTDVRYSVEAFYAMKCRYLRNWLQTQASGREIWLWGAGRVTRRRFDGVFDLITGFIDVDESKRGSYRDARPVRLADDLPARETSFILAGVAARGAREAICAHLTQRGWIEGRDFLLAA
jgi:glycosyltransferase involved in cell wall biosynthesis